MDAPVEPADRDRRRASRDRRRRVRDRRHFWTRISPSGGMGRVVRWFTGPWSSANGVSWLRLVILFLIVRWGFLTVYSIPTPSMEPTLHGTESLIARDRVAVNKLTFGPRYPFTGTRIIPMGTPKRWDIVVFNSPDPRDRGELLIKRIVGLPNEQVRIRHGAVEINGKHIDPPAELGGALNYTEGLEPTDQAVRRLAVNWAKIGKIPLDILKDTSPARMQLQRDLEKLGEELKGVSTSQMGPFLVDKHARKIAPAGLALVRKWLETQIKMQGVARFGVTDAMEYNLVPQGNYFVLGDNGPESIDSRIFGTVPRENLVGRAFAIVTPVSRARDLSGFLGNPRGRVIFWGMVLLIALWELVPGFVAFSWKVRGAIPAAGLAAGEHVLVDRLGYGLRIPFSQARFFWWRRPRPGEVVAFLMSRKGAFDVYFGDVVGIDESRRVIVRGPGGAGGRPMALEARDIVGRARFVWRPFARRRNIRPAATVESRVDNRLD